VSKAASTPGQKATCAPALGNPTRAAVDPTCAAGAARTVEAKPRPSGNASNSVGCPASADKFDTINQPCEALNRRRSRSIVAAPMAGRANGSRSKNVRSVDASSSRCGSVATFAVVISCRIAIRASPSGSRSWSGNPVKVGTQSCSQLHSSSRSKLSSGISTSVGAGPVLAEAAWTCLCCPAQSRPSSCYMCAA
jgi:hypothetical protein